MSFLQLTLSIGAADPAPFEDALLAVGASSITLEDAADDPVLEPAPGTTPLWPSVRLKALFQGDASRDHILIALQSVAQQMPLEAHFDVVEDRVWEREWHKDFRPMRFGHRLWICPGGQTPPPDLLRVTSHESRGASASVCIVELDPGLAFGTGTHPTTALCLEWLDGAALDGKRVLDYGCGSGVLAIAALKLGAREALALDIDPQALQATQDNAHRNGVSARLRTADASEQTDSRVDILLANILAHPLQQLARRFADLLEPNGDLVLSGILAVQAGAVASSYSPWFDMAPPIVRDEWARLDGVRRAAASC